MNQYSIINDGAAYTPSYDYDGNMTSTGRGWAYAWDAENRMKSATGATQSLEFKYDYMSRRIEKKVTTSGSVTKYLRFVYDGYKLIEELDAADSNAIKKKIVWSGETPISIYDTALDATYYYVLDGNKNVSELLDASGNIVAHYEYDSFGKIIVQSGAYADENPLRFSSEYYDSETNLVYYNYRYYNPDLGRWLSKDPIGEKGGTNLYSSCSNNLVDLVDFLGLDPLPYQRQMAAQMSEWFNKAQSDPHYCSGMDAAGMVDPSGVVDGVHSTFHLADGDYTGAALRAASLLPLGKAVKGAKLLIIEEGKIVEKAISKEAAEALSKEAFIGVEKAERYTPCPPCPGEVGSYVNTHESGTEYVGKGSSTRMEQSAKRVARENNDPLVKSEFEPAVGTTKAEQNRNAFKDESRKIEGRGGVDPKKPNSDLYNKIESPGKRYRQQDGDL